MRTTLIAAAILAALLALPTAVHAQPPRGGASSAAPSSIAVVDVTYILDNYVRLKRDTDKFKTDMQAAEADLKKERDALAKKAEGMKSLKPGTPDYKRLEEEIIKAESDWKLKVARQKSDFAERDAQNYLRAYKDIAQQVKLYAERHNISLVLRFNGAPVDPNNPQAVQMELSKMVMFYHKDIDITDPIVEALNAAGPTAQPPRGPQQPVKR